jgi:hypothetical protein
MHPSDAEDLGVGEGDVVRVESLRGQLASPFLLAYRAQRNRRRVIHGLLIPLTLTRTQYSAIPSNRGNERPLTYAEFANPCNAQQPLTAHS